MTYHCALITGASSGIGEAFARTLPPETDLLLTGRDGDRLDALRDQLGADGRRIETVPADLTVAHDRDRLIAAARDLPVDLLINNAGLGQLGLFTGNPPEREREMVELNCVAPVVITRALLPGMLDRARAQGAQGEGAKEGTRAGIIVVASTAAFLPLPRLATYSATKAFDLFFAEGLAGELSEEPVDVLALCPGATRTRFFERAGFKSRPLGPSYKPERVARDALAALGRRSVLVIGGSNRAFVRAASLLPRSLTRRGARSIMRKLDRRGD